MTLDKLAAATGLTKGYLSKLERGAKIPPIATLSLLAKSLGTDIASLLQQERAPKVAASGAVSLVRATERKRVLRGGSSFGYDYNALAQDIRAKHMAPFVFTFPAQILREVTFEHEGEEMVFVLSGVVEFQVGSHVYELSPGDCLYFDAKLPHRGCGKGGDAKALVVIYDPNADHEQAGSEIAK
jgi:transcriptional regulator with XRE-family HTH domain